MQAKLLAAEADFDVRRLFAISCSPGTDSFQYASMYHHGGPLDMSTWLHVIQSLRQHGGGILKQHQVLSLRQRLIASVVFLD